MSEQIKDFDVAVCIDSKGAYKAVLHKDVKFEMKTQFLHFKTSQKYIKGDINVVSDSCNFVQEIDTERYVKAFYKNSNDITNSYKDIAKIQLFRFKDGFSKIWHEYVLKQTNLASNIVIIVNDKNQPIYILHETNTSILRESITFKKCLAYQANDIKILNSYAVKTKTFFCNNKWNIKIENKTNQIFKNGICYNFVNKKVENEFFNQSFDVALITNTQNQMVLLLSEVTYIRNGNIISFKTDTIYKNGFYQKLKECAQLQKSLRVTDYRIIHENGTQKKYIFNKVKETNFIPNKCLMFTIKNIDAWIDFIEEKTNEFHDVGIITNTENLQIFFLNKVHVDGANNVINFGGCENFGQKHTALISKFGAFVKAISLKNYSLPSLEIGNNKLKNLHFYTWDMNKKPEPNVKRTAVPILITPAKSVPEQPISNYCEQEQKTNKKRRKKGKAKSEMPANLTAEMLKDDDDYKSDKKKKKNKKIKGKNGNKNVKKKRNIRSKSEMPNGVNEINKKRKDLPNKSRGSKKKNKLQINGKNKKKNKINNKTPKKKSKSALPTRTEADTIIKGNKKKKNDISQRKKKVNGKLNVKKGHAKRKSEIVVSTPKKKKKNTEQKSKGKSGHGKRKSEVMRISKSAPSSPIPKGKGKTNSINLSIDYQPEEKMIVKKKKGKKKKIEKE